ncbi:MAG: hypothetical protein AAF081_09880 [Actinomycetota bacterium]
MSAEDHLAIGDAVDQTVEGRAAIEADAAQAQAGRIGEKQSCHHFTNVVVRERTPTRRSARTSVAG